MTYLIKRPQVEARTGLSRSHLYALVKRGEFPPPIPLSNDGRAVAWSEQAVQAWIESRINTAQA